MTTVLVFVLLADAIVLGTAILLQAGQGGGLASLGGGAGTDNVMGGRQAVTLLTKVTWWCGGIFLGLSLIIALLSTGGTAPRPVLEGAVPAPTPVPTAPLPLQETPPATPGPAPEQ
jgi:preprotein translocase subunit SecG